MKLKFPVIAVAFCVPLTGFAWLFAGPSGGDLSKQQPKWKIDHSPPAPALTPEQELKTFKLPAGFHMELVAAEPQIEEPIALTFDPDGRMYVVELRGYMPDVDGHGELEPVGRVTLLEDTDGDGKVDKVTRFVEGLIAPRAVTMAGDGVIVAEPPNLWFCKDTDGDGKVDKKDLLAADYASRGANPEHRANGLIYGMDNWIYSANFALRFKYSKGQILRDSTISRGQWGLSQDDLGRWFYNSNSDMLRADLAPSQYLGRNPYLGNPAGLNVSMANNKVFTSRVNPGVNRGYTAVLNDKGYQVSVTAACGPAVYRGDKFPEDYRGNAFVCEPAGNVIIRHQITQNGAVLSGKSIQHDGLDFLTSTDERFRPVNLYTAPDGTMYVVDLYRGILQHGAYLSAYLRDQIKQRDLDKGIHMGRIWRIVSDAQKPGPQPHLSKASIPELVRTLSHPNGWWRDAAQRLLVQKQDISAVPFLDQVVRANGEGATPLAKIHALWALEGLGKLEDELVADAMKDPDPRVRVAAIRVSEPLLRQLGSSVDSLLALAKDPDDSVQLQVLGSAPAINLPEARAAVASILRTHFNNALFRSALLSGAVGREIDLLAELLKDPAFTDAGRGAAAKGADLVLNDLAECVVKSRSNERIDQLLEMIAAQPPTHSAAQHALLSGVVEAITPPAKGAAPRRLRLKAEPAGLVKLRALHDKTFLTLTAKAEAGMSWPGKPGDNTPPLKPLTAEQEKHFATGRDLYAQICGQCHQPSGLGQDGVAPALVDSEWVLGSIGKPARIILNGVHGPIKVGKKSLDLEMPGLGAALTDEQIASVLTYLRREWGHEASPVEPATIAEIRKDPTGRAGEQWTADELAKVK